MTNETSWLLRKPDPHAKARLFCLPFAGIGASAYRLWPTISEKFEICPIQFPGRENRFKENGYDNIEELSNDLLNELIPYIDRPYVIFGHCMGALLAYELILQMMKRNIRKPDHFYVSASRAPHSRHRGKIHLDLTDNELTDILINNSIEFHEPELLRLIMPNTIRLLRKDLAMCDRYQPEIHKIEVPITTFTWRNDQNVTFNELIGWRSYSDIREYFLDGNHFSVQNSSSLILPIIDKNKIS
ncbi:MULTISPECIES: thioesterase domain-containing protein [Mammaliicoccus]|uniref:thioesterase II family protein n=1 Tax=Mammaliicoccus TaxID=2803850 RepID=UPI001EFB7D6A|nr:MULTISPECIES: thioesterase domain-containing protein [Mammaliicoccus]